MRRQAVQAPEQASVAAGYSNELVAEQELSAPIPAVRDLAPEAMPLLSLAASAYGSELTGGYLADEGLGASVEPQSNGISPYAVGQPPAPAPAARRPARTLYGLPPHADAAREVAHEEGWWENREEDDSAKYEARELGDLYANEQFDATRFRGAASNWDSRGDRPDERTFSRLATQHWSEDTIDDHEVEVADGKLTVGGSALDTRDASGIGTQTAAIGGQRLLSGKGKYIYTMDKDGRIATADAWKEHREVPLGMDAGGKEAHELRMVNHSSLLGGEGAAGAGELMVEDGKLQQITDASGHYMPSGQMTANVVKELGERGVDTHDVATRLTRNGGNEQQLHASARELLEVQSKLDATGSSEDARDVMTRRRDEFRTDLEDHGRGSLTRHVDVEAVEQAQRARSGERLGKVV